LPGENGKNNVLFPTASHFDFLCLVREKSALGVTATRSQFSAGSARRYFFIVPPGDAASPFLSAAPAVLAPCVLASFADGIELFFFISEPAPVEVVVLLVGPLSAPALPWLGCANAKVVESAKIEASAIALIAMVVSSG
jgi:hypothetical protein